MSLELEDHSWFPIWLRRYQMEYISWMAVQFALYAPLVPLMNTMQQKDRIREWTDCCTGAAGPVQYLLNKKFAVDTIFLTDKYLQPVSISAPNSGVYFETIDVLNDPIPGKGLVTMFNALHHFSPQERQAIIAAIISTNRPFVFAEITHPTLINFLAITLATTFGQLLFTPFVHPFKFRRLLFTYLIPINLFSITWDGWMSVFRSISDKRFIALANKTSTPNYSVSFVQKGPWWQKVSILTGQPNI